ncbi:Hypothetical predicted protein [Paramuricea clavata]|uniref:Uncharacterized protein n=1 Tax=Paramuricea clavata TaxID=317549 RepID=A0A6S7JSG0_PARCT|nr:Hypothetical predicted protein [Paramuricea clavata]
MKVNNNPTRWIIIDHQASSLYNLTKDGNFTSTSVGVKAWKSLVVHRSFWEKNGHNYGYHEGFNFCNEYVYARIGFSLNTTCKAFLGLGTLFYSTEDKKSSITYGYALCNEPGTKFAASGYIFVQ